MNGTYRDKKLLPFIGSSLRAFRFYISSHVFSFFFLKLNQDCGWMLKRNCPPASLVSWIITMDDLLLGMIFWLLDIALEINVQELQSRVPRNLREAIIFTFRYLQRERVERFSDALICDIRMSNCCWQHYCCCKQSPEKWDKVVGRNGTSVPLKVNVSINILSWKLCRETTLLAMRQAEYIIDALRILIYSKGSFFSHVYSVFLFHCGASSKLQFCAHYAIAGARVFRVKRYTRKEVVARLLRHWAEYWSEGCRKTLTPGERIARQPLRRLFHIFALCHGCHLQRNQDHYRWLTFVRFSFHV